MGKNELLAYVVEICEVLHEQDELAQVLNISENQLNVLRHNFHQLNLVICEREHLLNADHESRQIENVLLLKEEGNLFRIITHIIFESNLNCRKAR